MSQTAFNRFGTRTRGDTSGWTDTPEIAAKRAAGLLTDSSTGARLTAAPLTGAESSAPVSATLKAAMEQYGQHRQKSLLELHAERQAAGNSKGGSSKSEKQRLGDKDEKKKKSKSEKKDKDKDKKSDKDRKGACLACLLWPCCRHVLRIKQFMRFHLLSQDRTCWTSRT